MKKPTSFALFFGALDGRARKRQVTGNGFGGGIGL